MRKKHVDAAGQKKEKPWKFTVFDFKEIIWWSMVLTCVYSREYVVASNVGHHGSSKRICATPLFPRYDKAQLVLDCVQSILLSS